MTNIQRPDFQERPPRDGFRARRARVGWEAGAERIGASLWEVDPGQAAYPYHFHLTEEELVVVLSGLLELRTPTGRRELAEGDVVAFPRGEAGAHQFVNRTDAPARFLAVSTSGEPDVVLYPDSGKVFAGERRPGGAGFSAVFRVDDSVDYYEGEKAPE